MSKDKKNKIELSVQKSTAEHSSITPITDTAAEEHIVRNMPKRFKKPNYYKYPSIKGQLIESLDGTYTAAEISKNLKITQQTLFKYKSLAQLETGLELKTLEEKIQLNKSIN
ncbi:hypothetical protein C4J81_01770 [Deltaproteobacteria bacterium Smac51]|nr:hypothetical protein C4J81_01770 [Deltaproteobacteria bacterium Smac51]